MTCAELKELAGALALGALDPEEQAACDAHLAEPRHEGCHEAVAAARAILSSLPAALPPVRPRAAVWDGIAAQIGAPRRRVPLWVAVPGWIAAAAAAVFLLVDRGDRGALRDRVRVAEQQTTATRQQYDVCAGELGAVRKEQAAQAEAMALLGLPGTQVVAMAPQGNAAERATAIVHRESGRAVVVGRGLVAQAGKDYELWVLRGDQKLPAGLLRAGPEGSHTMVVDPALLKAGVDAFAITLEPAGGSDSPRGPILLVGKV